MKSATTRFLDAYKSWESAVRASGRDTADFEDVSTTEGARLRICRLVRNYLSHNNDPGFVEPMEKMIVFMEKMAENQLLAGDSVKKHLKKPEAALISCDEKVHVAVKRMLPFRCELVAAYNGPGYKVYSMYDLVSTMLAKPATTKVRDVKALKVKPVFVKPTDSMETVLAENVTLCTTDGSPDGVLLGRVFK